MKEARIDEEDCDCVLQPFPFPPLGPGGDLSTSSAEDLQGSHPPNESSRPLENKAMSIQIHLPPLPLHTSPGSCLPFSARSRSRSRSRLGATMEAENSQSESFRPLKRKRFYRRRPADEGEEDGGRGPATVLTPEPSTMNDTAAEPEHVSTPPRDQIDNPTMSVQEIVRRRKLAQRHKAGIEFSKESNSEVDQPISNELSVRAMDGAEGDTATAEIDLLVSRFAPQTGHVVEATDEHMYVVPTLPHQSAML